MSRAGDRDDDGLMAAVLGCRDSELTVAVDAGPSAVTVVLQGELDLAAHDRMHSAISHAIDDAARAGRACAVDLGGVRYIDCSSVRELVTLAASARERATQLLIVRPSPIVCRMLRLTGYDGALSVVPGATSGGSDR
jgi:anti-anti-sigma factor